MTDRISPSGVAIGRQAALSSMQARLAAATGELSSGRKADPAGATGLGASLLYKLHDQIAQGDALNEAIDLASKRMETMQTALTSVNGVITDLSKGALQANALSGASFNVLAAQARDSMATMMDQLNVQFDGQHLFAGTDSARTPLAGPSAALGIVQGQLTAHGPVDATSVAAFISQVQTAFDAGYQGTVYTSASVTGGAPTQVRIGAGETLSYDVRADSPAMRKTFLATSLLSMLDKPDAQISQDAKDIIAEQAGNMLRDAHAGLTDVAGVLGAKQGRLQAVVDIQSQTMTAAAQQINTLEGVDYAATADRINQLQLQLQATYAITAKLSELSLVNYIR